SKCGSSLHPTRLSRCSFTLGRVAEARRCECAGSSTTDGSVRRDHELAKGVERLREFVATRPDSAPLEHLPGQWYKRAGDSAGARTAFEKAKASDPKYVAADLSLAEMDITDGRNSVALDGLRPVIAGNGGNVSALLMSARAQEGTRDYV